MGWLGLGTLCLRIGPNAARDIHPHGSAASNSRAGTNTAWSCERADPNECAEFRPGRTDSNYSTQSDPAGVSGRADATCIRDHMQ